MASKCLGGKKATYVQVLLNLLSPLGFVASASSNPLWTSPLTPLSLHPVALQCPAHSLFTNCLPSCLPSCSNLDGHCEGVSTKVPSTCKEGCLCHPGFVFNEDKCVPRVQCGCKDTQGTFIPVSGRGESVWGNFILLSASLSLGYSCLNG